MSERPYVTLSCAMSIDGHLDGVGQQRLAMSNSADLDRVDQVRAEHDAIMVGASTIRRDNPRLTVKNAERRARRIGAGMPEGPAKLTVTATGDIPVDAAFFTTGEVDKFVYCPTGLAGRLESRLGDAATVVALGERVAMAGLLDDLAERGIDRLMVEGGGNLLTQFLAADLVDELQLVIAPFFVGDAAAPRVVDPAVFPWTASRRATLADTRQIGDVVLLRYALSDRFRSSERVGAQPSAEGRAQPAGTR